MMELGRRNCCNDGIEKRTEWEKIKSRSYCRTFWSSIVDSFQSEDIGVDRELSVLFRYLKITSIGSQGGKISRFYRKNSKSVMELGSPTLPYDSIFHNIRHIAVSMRVLRIATENDLGTFPQDQQAFYII